MDDPDIFRILVATDNHLGYQERDPIRGMDSFAAFEEILLVAKKKRVDFVLLGGDLFHDNKPSRRSLYRTMDILRKHCLGPDPVSFKIISDQAANFKNRYGCVNYEDENFSVGLPVFSIHGNHDDPTREGGIEALAALDLLSVANLVNYFGKSEKVDDVEVMPILMKKGATKIALYGLGSMRDERLNRMWNQKKVKFLRPSEKDGRDEFFNIFVLHQNRDLGRGKKNCVHESMIPEWMDLVVWGHEHECQINPIDSLVGTFRITQPGSSVATSLVEGEAVQKRLGILEIRLDQFRLNSELLTQVRPFKVDEISLADIQDLDPDNPKVDEAVASVLTEKIEEMIQELHPESTAPQVLRGQEYKVEKRDQVLIRLKVEHSGFQSLNNQRFGSQFVGRVANPSELLIFHKRRIATEPKKEAKDDSGRTLGGLGNLQNPIAPEELDEIKVEDLVKENLETSTKKLTLLDEKEMNLALENYVHKEDIRAISEAVDLTLEKTQRLLKKDKSADSIAQIQHAVKKRVDKLKSRAVSKQEGEDATSKDTGNEDGPHQGRQNQNSSKRRQQNTGLRWSDGEDDGNINTSVSPQKGHSAKTTSRRRGVAQVLLDLDSDQDVVPPSKSRKRRMPSPSPPSSPTPSPARAGRRTKSAAQKKITSSLGTEENIIEDFESVSPTRPTFEERGDDDDLMDAYDVENGEEFQMPAPKRRKGRAAASAPKKAEKKTTGHKATKSRKATRGRGAGRGAGRSGMSQLSLVSNSQGSGRRRLPRWSQQSQQPENNSDSDPEPSTKNSSLVMGWGSAK